jgi:hypothetical protein
MADSLSAIQGFVQPAHSVQKPDVRNEHVSSADDDRAAAWAQEESQAGHAQLSRRHDSFYGPDSRRGLESCGVVHPDRREPSPNCAAGFQKLAMFGPTTGFLPK